MIQYGEGGSAYSERDAHVQIAQGVRMEVRMEVRMGCAYGVRTSRSCMELLPRLR